MFSLCRVVCPVVSMYRAKLPTLAFLFALHECWTDFDEIWTVTSTTKPTNELITLWAKLEHGQGSRLRQ